MGETAPSEIAVRCYTVPANDKPHYGHRDLPDLPDRFLVFDTETTIDKYQNLTFGSFHIIDYDKLVYQGLFYGDVVTDEELATLQKYANDHDLQLYSVQEFVDQVFYPEIYELETVCVGFNLPFDLSRLALHHGNSRKMKDGFSFQLSENPAWPRLIIKHVNSTMAFIQFTNTIPRQKGSNKKRKESKKFRGHFLDLRTLTFALTNQKHSLASACKHFESDIQKTSATAHGQITLEYIRYNLNDVEATYQLYRKLLAEYETYELDLPSTKIYSPASIGKAYLDMMGIRSFGEKNPEFSKEVLGYVMSTYYGGRAEVRIRRQPTEIALIDFLSMYPTMCILQDLWQYVIADHVEWHDDTDNVRAFVDALTLDDVSNPDMWKQLDAIVQVKPDEDILPVRCRYGGKNAYNIGVNYLSSDQAIWYTLADVVASKLLTGKNPEIVRAIRFTPVGIQNGLRRVDVVGELVNPARDDMFRVLMEYRHRLKKQDDPREHIVKIITNASSYGIFVEMNPQESLDTELEVYGREQFTVTEDIVERPGKAFNPLMATFITSASRLVLAISEAMLQRHGATYAFCDTDSLAVPPNYVQEIQDLFQPLSPYSFDAPLFKLEPQNYNEEGELEPLWCYGISAKRYVLYHMRDGQPMIRKHSLHGLGHILNPFPSCEGNWHSQIWEDILAEHYGLVSSEEIYEKYRKLYAISQLTVSSPHVMHRFKEFNQGRPYEKQIKPFNFVLVGTANQTNPKTRDPIIPLVPFQTDRQQVPYQPFVDYNTGETLQGIEYWKPLDSIYFDYKIHPEAKFQGDIGVLDRQHLTVDSIIHIGKETNNMEESQVVGVQSDSYQTYMDAELREQRLHEFILNLEPKDAEKYGISERQLRRWKAKLRDNSELRFYSNSEKKLKKAMNQTK